MASTECDGDVPSDYTIIVVYDNDIPDELPTFNLNDVPSAYAFKLGQSWRQALPRCAYGDDEGFIYEMDLRDADTFLEFDQVEHVLLAEEDSDDLEAGVYTVDLWCTNTLG